MFITLAFYLDFSIGRVVFGLKYKWVWQKGLSGVINYGAVSSSPILLCILAHVWRIGCIWKLEWRRVLVPNGIENKYKYRKKSFYEEKNIISTKRKEESEWVEEMKEEKKIFKKWKKKAS